MKDPIGDLTDEQRSGPVKLGGIKLFMDGSISNRTAWTKDVYRDSDEHGMPTQRTRPSRPNNATLGAKPDRHASRVVNLQAPSATRASFSGRWARCCHSEGSMRSPTGSPVPTSLPAG